MNLNFDCLFGCVLHVLVVIFLKLLVNHLSSAFNFSLEHQCIGKQNDRSTKLINQGQSSFFLVCTFWELYWSMVSALSWTSDCPSACKPGCRYCVVFLGKRHNSHGISLHAVGNSTMGQYSGGQGGDRNTPKLFYATETGDRYWPNGLPRKWPTSQINVKRTCLVNSKYVNPIDLCFFQVPEHEIDKAIELLNSLRVT